MPEVTSVQVKYDTWDDLNGLKRPGDSMDDVISQLIALQKECEDGGETAPAGA